MKDLAQHIQSTPLMDTHEHQNKEKTYLESGPDILTDLFFGYPANDLLSAGAPLKAVEHLMDSADPDLEARWNGVKNFWPHCQYSGYGWAVRYMAREIYGIEELTLQAIEAAQPISEQRRQPGERLRILRDDANLDHIQVDDFTWECAPDRSGPDFFLYDLSWVRYARGNLDFEGLRQVGSVDVADPETLRQAYAGVFAAYGDCAIAVKSQHAYERTLFWQERGDAEIAPLIEKLRQGGTLDEAETQCLGDWSLARGVELAIEHNLPVKIHTGYLAGVNNAMHYDRLSPANLSPLLARYPAARFVLMHLGYPYTDEMIALAKHFTNVYVDLCWAWSINPLASSDFVRRFLHAVPINKLFIFGGDTFWPSQSVAFAAQARLWLTRTLQAEIDADFLSEQEAINLATRLMQGNQRDCFDLDGTRAALHTQLAVAD